MASAGVSTSPIRLISGNSPFCETYFENVEVPKQNLVGELNKGWDIAKYLLTHEREMISEFGLGGASEKPLHQAAVDKLGTQNGKLVDQGLRMDIARYEIDALAFSYTLERCVDEASGGEGLGAKSSMLKYYGTELNKTRLELLMDANGADGLGWEGEGYSEGALPRAWLRSRANSIEGGTSEVQLNIVARRILNLPA